MFDNNLIFSLVLSLINTGIFIAMTYKEFFKDKPYSFVEEPTNSQSNYWLNAIILQDK